MAYYFIHDSSFLITKYILRFIFLELLNSVEEQRGENNQNYVSYIKKLQEHLKESNQM